MTTVRKLSGGRERAWRTVLRVEEGLEKGARMSGRVRRGVGEAIADGPVACEGARECGSLQLGA